jgi:hypothetical protein
MGIFYGDGAMVKAGVLKLSHEWQFSFDYFATYIL